MKYLDLRINTGILFLLFTGVLFGQDFNSLVKNFNAAKSDTLKISIADKIVKKTSREEPIEGLIYAKKGYAISKNTAEVKYKIMATLSLAQAYYLLDSNERSIVFNKEAVELLKKANDPAQMADVYMRISMNCNELSKGKEAKDYIEKSIALSKSTGNKKMLAKGYNGLGSAEFRLGNYDAAIKSLYESFHLYEQLNSKNEMALTAKNISLVYEKIMLYEESEKMIMKALSIYISIKDTMGIAESYGAIGSLKNAISQGDSAAYYIKKQLGYLEKFQDKNAKAMALGNLAITYKNARNFKAAEEQFLKVRNLFNEMNNQRLSVVSSINLGDLYTETRQFSKSLPEFELGVKYGFKTGERDIIVASYNGLYTAYSGLKDYKNALNYYEKSIWLKDSLLSQDNLNQIASIENRYKTEKVETENKLLRSQNALVELELDAADAKAKNARYKVYALSFGFLLMVALCLLSLRAYRQKRRNNVLLEEKNSIITKQRDLVENQKVILEHKNKEILDSINYAKRLQDAILPPLTFFNQNLPDSFVLYKPKDIVAGDFYWMERIKLIDREVILFAAADCTGHGVPGALVSVVCCNALNRAVKEFGIIEPGKILDKVKELVVETFEKSENEVRDGMDISLCSFNPQSNEISWSGANNALWIVKKEEKEDSTSFVYNGYSLKEVKPNKQPIGKSEGSVPYLTHYIQLSSMDTVYLFTDGFADQFGGPTGKKFKSLRFKETLLKIQHLDMEEQKNTLATSIDDWKGDLEQVDDVCIIGFKLKGPI